MEQIKLQDLKSKSPTELLALAEENDIENASTMRKQDMMFAILKELAEQGVFIIGEGVVEKKKQNIKTNKNSIYIKKRANAINFFITPHQSKDKKDYM